ncbi:N-acetylglucosamine-6-phosphate deacetylase [Microbacterium sp. RD1]|uniref:N-acetylglucosamine-6-phosphate deacetylase n=1 Tax=Microbacterium sp. RD1 TaxID=3457313 RepID=UPI003FA5B560
MSAPAGLLLTAAHVVDPDASAPGWLRVENGVIVDRGAGTAPNPEGAAIYETDVVMPGFVDIHVHGARGVDFAELGVDPQPAIDYHAAHGATTLVASIATGPMETTAARLRELQALVRSGALEGIHLEGPWLSPQRRGAHRLELLRSPELREVEALLEAAGGTVRMVTIAPELPGAIEAIAALTRHGVVAAIGHTDADAATAQRAIDAGATVVTHLFNGMRPLHHRDPGPVGVALAHRQLAVELIADGIHVDDVVIDAVLRAADDSLILVSDGMAATGLGDGEYELAGSHVVVAGGIAELADGTSLAGSTATLGGIVARLRSRGVAPSRLLAAASSRPSAVLGLSAPSLRIGDVADLVTVAADRTLRTMKAGRWLAS